MAYCPECGADIGEAAKCPLCGTQNPKSGLLSNTNSNSHSHIEVNENDSNSKEEKKMGWEVLSVAFCISIIALIAVNLFESRIVSWSLYPVAALVLVWIEASVILVFSKYAVIRIVAGAASPLAFLIALGFISGNPRWALGLALPIALLSESIGFAVYFVLSRSKHKGLNIVALLLVAISVLCIGLEIFIDLFSMGFIAFRWSPICAIALLPISGFLMYLHFRIMKSANLRRIFHI